MTTNNEYTYGFYLIALAHIQREMANNRTAYRHVQESKDINLAILNLMNKYNSGNKSYNIVTKTITHNQAVSSRLDSQFRTLQSEYDRLTAYMQNNKDVAGAAYDIAYNDTPASYPKPKTIFARIANLFTSHTK